MMGRYTIRACAGRLIARISTERHGRALRRSVSQSDESEKRVTGLYLHFHIQFQSPTFLHRQSHTRPFHADRKNAAKRNSRVFHLGGNTQTTQPERGGPGSFQWRQKQWMLAAAVPH